MHKITMQVQTKSSFIEKLELKSRIPASNAFYHFVRMSYTHPKMTNEVTRKTSQYGLHRIVGPPPLNLAFC